MTKRELENFCWKWGRHIEVITAVTLFLLICAFAWLARH